MFSLNKKLANHFLKRVSREELSGLVTKFAPQAPDGKRLTSFIQGINSPVNFVQVGANNGIDNDHIHPFIDRNWSGYRLEPVGEYYQQLLGNNNSSSVIPINIGIGSSDGSALIFRPEYSDGDDSDWKNGIASLDPNHHEKSGVSKSEIIQEEIQLLTWASFCKKYDICDLDLLVTDTEGFDYNILCQVLAYGVMPKVIISEHAMRHGVMSALEMSDLISNFSRLDYDIHIFHSDVVFESRR